MALIARTAVLLGILGLYTQLSEAYKISNSQKKDAKFGRPVLAMANSPRCMFNGKPVEDGRSVSSPEPCLNCTCSKGILLCYLRTCTTVVATPGCQVVRKKGECCPKLECRGITEYRTERTSEPSYKYRLRQDEGAFFGLSEMDPRTDKSNSGTTTTTRKPAPKFNYNQDSWSSSKINRPSEFSEPEDPPIEQEEDYGSDLSPDKNDSTEYCYHKGYKYTEGMAMLSTTKCEYCYCIRGQQMCVRPKCHMNIEGCVARYQSGYTCCPSHYQCEIGADGIGIDEYQLPPAKGAQGPVTKVSSCNVEGYDFDVGVAVPSSGNCQTCYCTQMGVVCRRLECSPSVPGCTPIVPEGHCCPTEYKCDQQGANETQVPVSFSTENYDVTVIAPSETEGESSHSSTTDTTDDIMYEESEDHTAHFDYEYDTDSVSEKQKITVELTGDSDIESISVIPEENIAVLVVTTEKETEQDAPPETSHQTHFIASTTKINPDMGSPSYIKHKTKTSTTKVATTVTEGTQHIQEATKPTIISLPNLKQKTKPSTSKHPTTVTHGTQYLQDTTRPSLASFSNLKHKTKTSTTNDPSTAYGTQPTQDATRPSISLTNLKQKTKPSTTNDRTTVVHGTRYPQDTTRPSIISLTNLKQKTKPSPANVPTTITQGTRYPQDTTRPSIISLTNLKQKTKPSPVNVPTTITQGTQYSRETTSPAIISLTNLKQKTKTSTTKDDQIVASASPHLLDSTQPTLISLLHLKQKTKTSTTKVSPATLEDKTSESSTFIHSTADLDTSTETVKYSTHRDPDNTDENKDNYAYDYVEIYDDVPHNTQETFAPFADYSETTYGEKFTSTEKSPDVTINTRVKIKNKRPPSLSQTRDPTTSAVITSIANSKFATDGLTTQRITETDPGHSTHSTFSHTETDKYTDYPTRYTIYSTASEKTHRPYATESGGRLKQKVKPNTPFFLTNTQYVSPTIQGTNPFYSTMAEISTRTTQTEKSHTGADQTYQYVTETNVPSSHSFKPPTLVTSRFKQKPQRPSQTTLPFKSTKPLPQDLADLLWSITQNYNTQEQDTSTETYSSTTEKVSSIIKTSETPDYVPDTLTSLVIAAPKLIVEDTAANESQVNLQSDTTDTDTPTSGSVPPNNGSPLPGLIFKIPEVIFSNHGPSSHRKQPTTSRDPDMPIEINNHKKTTRPRPPVRFRPPPTPSVPQTSFIEISNHRPGKPIRRPPGKFPPYPTNNQRPDASYRRQQNTRDPHHSVHRIAPDMHPEWREDYDEYYYDFELSRNPTTKVFTNMQDQPTETEGDSLKTTQPETQSPGTSLQPSTRKNDLSTNPITENNPHGQDEMKPTTLEFKETSKTSNQDDITGRSSADITEINDPTLYITLSTTPHPTTTEDLSTSTKYFSKDTVPDDEGKLFRAEDNNKDIKNGFIDQRHGQYEGNPNKFEVIDGRPSAERPVLKPLSSIPETSPNEPNEPTKSEEDSKEINDVCFVDGRYYNSGEIIVKSNPCEMCRCFYGHPLCQVQQCPAPPEPSCVLEYLPGYCCPRVTCGVKVDSSQSSSEVSAPDPTNQEIRPPLITSDNQWKPLPHGPIVRPVDVLPKIETPIPEVVTVPPQPVLNDKTASEDIRQTELNTENSRITEGGENLEESFSASTTPTTTIFTTVSPQTTTNNVRSVPTTTQRVEITTYFPEITTEPTTEPKPVFEPAPEEKDSEGNKSDIHDNSSGVRKVLDETVTLPPSKMSLSPSNGENISTVLPVIQTLPPTPFVTEGPLSEVDTVVDFLIGDLPAELGGNLKVSGCNVYGKYYRINDKVTALSKPCSECICSPDGIACNATC